MTSALKILALFALAYAAPGLLLLAVGLPHPWLVAAPLALAAGVIFGRALGPASPPRLQP